MTEDTEMYKEILDNLFDGVYFVDEQRRITYWNKGAERISGYRSGEVLGSSCADNLLMHVDEKGEILCLKGCPLMKTIQDGQVREAEVFMHHAHGHRLPVRVRAAALRDERGAIVGAVETFSDNTSMIAFQQQVELLSKELVRDPLTGVCNRRSIESRLQGALAELEHQPLRTGLLFIDIDNFKLINDEFGHNAGDLALKMAANTMLHNLRASDALGRWGGDEFLALLFNLDAAALERISRKLLALIERSSLEYAGRRIRLTVSIGATLLHPGESAAEAAKRADELMYLSKQAGGNRVCFEA